MKLWKKYDPYFYFLDLGLQKKLLEKSISQLIT